MEIHRFPTRQHEYVPCLGFGYWLLNLHIYTTRHARKCALMPRTGLVCGP